MRTPAALVAAVCSLALAFGCTRPLDQAAVAVGGGGSAGGDLTGGAGADAGAGGGAPVSTCDAPTFLLVGAENQLYAFDPKKDTAKPLGGLSCVESKDSTVVSAALAADGMTYYLLDNQQILFAKSGDPTICALWDKPPEPSALSLAFNGGVGPDSKTERLIIATKESLFATDPPPTAQTWDVLGKLPSGSGARALLGTGDGRLFAVLTPSSNGHFPVARLDLSNPDASAIVLVPAPDANPDAPAGFALFGDQLLMFAEKALTRYSFSTGEVGTSEFLPDVEFPIVAVAAPACASTAR